MSNGPWNSRSVMYNDNSYLGDANDSSYHRSSVTYSSGTAAYGMTATAPLLETSGPVARPDVSYSGTPVYSSRPPSLSYGTSGAAATYGSHKSTGSQGWEAHGRYSPSDSLDDIIASPSLSDYALDNGAGTTSSGKSKSSSTGRPQRRPSNRDEFDGPHQFLARPPTEYQERELPHLPTNLLVQEQDSVLSRVNDRLSQCAFDFVAKYQFPIPLTQDMRPVERPQDREWTEWVYLLKRLATKRRIPARVLYNGQIKQFVTILENSLEMRHAAKHQSRPLKDDRNILQLISAGIQVAKILKDAQAMDYLDRLYVSTEQRIQDRTAAASVRFR
ncbi:Uu.00g002280.m01.CDS01 [Anthostomella pinea]|uniref:Uu.00g002280.m01.CDS01 n=1 Tax=Anthostomella pinea TaxID=933095 RepID=A0AAI8VE85_9PEZI|nr:Uu.00g002280.m01.CDS01 [Anthostomella pinea]